jgi:RNA polymerase sigma-70 factor (sigma-E family)
MNRTRDAEFTAYVTARGQAWERYAYALTDDRQQAQDLVQTVLLQAYRRWDRISAAEHPDAYLRRMLTNSYLDWRRRRRNSEVPTDNIPDEKSSPDPAIGVVDRDELRRALRLLSPHQRAVLVLRHVEGLEDEAIAALLGCSVGTVRSHAANGRQRIRRAITEIGSAPTISEETR